MSESALAPLQAWLAVPLDRDVEAALERLRHAPDVQRIAVMPDVHLASNICVGVVVATTHLIYPQAVGGDIGCGMLAVAFDGTATCLDSPSVAGQVLSLLGQAVPARRRNRRAAIELPPDLAKVSLSDAGLDSVRRTVGKLEFGTLGSGNHFTELQADEEDRLWLMVHSGSRGMGQAIWTHHKTHAKAVGGGLLALEAESDEGRVYLDDVGWARRFAEASRRAIAREVEKVVSSVTGARLCWETEIVTDHNHVALEHHMGRSLFVHRKGAMPASAGQPGVLPGSMGSRSYHVEGRGHAPALCSSAHGAGRSMSRTEARRQVTRSALRRQMAGVWYDFRLEDELRDEAPAAYKDIGAVLRAQAELVKITRVLRPVLNYKGVG